MKFLRIPLLLALSLLAFAPQAFSAIALTSQNDNGTSGTTTTVALTVSAGDLIVCAWVIRNGGAFTSVVGSLNGTYTTAGGPAFLAARAGIHFFQNSAAGSETVTLTGASDTMLMNCQNYSGAHTTAALLDGQTTTNTTVTSHPHSATGVNATAGQLMVTVAGQSSTITDETVASGFTELQTTNIAALGSGNNRAWFQFRIATGTESNQVAAFTASSHSSATMIALFDQAAAGGGVVVNPITGLGGAAARPIN